MGCYYPSDVGAILCTLSRPRAEGGGCEQDDLPGRGRTNVSLADARTAASIFDPQRLRVARQLRKLTRSTLADEVGVSPAAVGQWESGEVRPKPQTLLEISRVLGFPVAYFATSGRMLSNLETERTFFRSLRRSRQIDREAAMAHAALIAELVSVIERHARLPALNIPEYPVDIDASDADIDAVAARVRDDWGLEDEPIDDIVRESSATVRWSLA